MNQDERRKLENQLVVMGLNRLDDPELIQEMAKLINQHPGFSNPHAFFLGFINECDQSKRREMYDALLPHLKFAVWPLDKYVTLLKQHASNVESHYDPVKIGTDPVKFGGHEFQEVPEDMAHGCILKLTCYKCTKSEEYYGQTPVTAITVARGDGWKRDLVAQKEICPKCAKGRRKGKR